MGCCADGVHEGLEAVDETHRRIAYVAPRHIGAGKNERNARRLLVHRRLPPHAARAEVVAVIARVDHAGVFRKSGGFERREYPADVVVEERDESHVRGDGAAHHRRVERLVEAQALAHRVDERMAWPLARFVHVGPRHLVLRIHRVELGRRDEREVR
jgi:hypothetical protein